MLSSRLEKFIAKRVLIFFIVLAILVVVFFSHRFFILAGLTVGGVFSILRLNSLTAAFSRILLQNVDKGAVRIVVTRFVINSVIAIVLLAASLNFNQWFFGGVAAGIFLVPLVIIVNALTEASGITRNNFE